MLSKRKGHPVELYWSWRVVSWKHCLKIQSIEESSGGKGSSLRLNNTCNEVVNHCWVSVKLARHIFVDIREFCHGNAHVGQISEKLSSNGSDAVQDNRKVVSFDAFRSINQKEHISSVADR